MTGRAIGNRCLPSGGQAGGGAPDTNGRLPHVIPDRGGDLFFRIILPTFVITTSAKYEHGDVSYRLLRLQCNIQECYIRKRQILSGYSNIALYIVSRAQKEAHDSFLPVSNRLSLPVFNG